MSNFLRMASPSSGIYDRLYVIIMHKESVMSVVNITNASNGTIAVAIAHLQGDFVSEGWFDLVQNQTQQFSADDSVGLCVRVQDSNGNDITFSNLTTPEFFTYNPSTRFSVTRVAGDPTGTRVLRSGSNLENVVDMNPNSPFPAGWANGRFFAVGSGTANEFVNPP
jgi:hypothetical protein